MESDLDNGGENAFLNLPEFRQAIAEFQAAAAKPYYDEAADAAARDEYYQDVQPGNLNKQEFYEALSRLLGKTHTGKINYKPAVHLYPWVDLHVTGSQLRLKSIYSEKEFNPEDLIAEDFRIEQQRADARGIDDAKHPSGR